AVVGDARQRRVPRRVTDDDRPDNDRVAVVLRLRLRLEPPLRPGWAPLVFHAISSNDFPRYRSWQKPNGPGVVIPTNQPLSIVGFKAEYASLNFGWNAISSPTIPENVNDRASSTDCDIACTLERSDG